MYLVIAYRTSKNSEHSYTVGIFDHLIDSELAADEECNNRGGKYSVYVYEVEINKIIDYAKSEAKFIAKGRE